MEFLQNIRQNLFNTSANQPQQGQESTFLQRLQDPRFLGLLSAAAAIPKVGTAEGLAKGAQVFNMFSAADEERKRKELMQQLVSEGGFTEREKALIAATPSQNQAALIQQINARKAAANKPNIFQQRQDIGTKRGLEGTDLNTFVLTGDLPKAPTQTKVEALTMISGKDVTIGDRLIPANTPFNINATDQELFNKATDQGAYTIAKPQQITQTTLPPMETVESIENVIEQTEGQVEGDKFDIGTAAGGDVKGVVTDLANAFLGFTVGLPLSEERSRQSAFIANANNQIKVPMVRALAPRGAKYARDEIDKILPQSTDSNPKFVSKLKELLPDIQDTIEVIANDIAVAEIKDGEGTAIALRGQLRGLLNYKLSAENALKNFNENDEKSAEEIAADAILELSK